ncbi:MAG TPA: type II/IV secretion system ATPase subunit [Candidatus Nanoarchaeia archaeon]|nr:type II/IV secretion system ATPase subunit [Candidatus Nanoarchaeia archaeon]
MPGEKRAEYSLAKEGAEEILKIDANSWSHIPGIEDDEQAMGRVIELLSQLPSVYRIIINQRRNYSYGPEQTSMLTEIATVYNYLIKAKRILSYAGTTPISAAYYAEKNPYLQNLVLGLLPRDPLGCYAETKRFLREEHIALQQENNPSLREAKTEFVQLLTEMIRLLEKTKIVKYTEKELEGYHLGDRSIYRTLFRPTITPDFLFTRVMAQPPIDAEEIDAYSVKDNEVTIYRKRNDVSKLYHINPPEFKLDEDKYELLQLARNVLAEYRPKEKEFLEPEKIRRTFFNIGRDLLQELSQNKGMTLSYEEIEQLANILVRYTVGFGLIESLLQDEKIQDITVNSPVGKNPIFLVHQDYDECYTNILPTKDDADSWATKFRLLSGRPLDEANPILDTELSIPGARARVAILNNPLSPSGLAFALRRQRDNPWTLPLFIQRKMITPLAAGLMSFLIDGGRTILVAGTRSAGKTSLLTSLMVEIMKKTRIVTCEDTLEIPIDSFKDIGYNIQSMKVRSALTSGTSELAAEEGVRASLRLGDSALIVGEIRSKEAQALYEAMRIGALANVVMGTIHGADPYSVYDRVVNDLQVPKTSFKATDIILVVNPIKSVDGLKKSKRLVSISEVRKTWENDPLLEGGFVDLMKYHADNDTLEPTTDLTNGDSEVLKSIAGNVKEWAGSWDAIWDNILLRSKMKQTIVDFSELAKQPDLLEAPFVVESNDVFHRISDDVKQEVGSLDTQRIYITWENWLKKSIKLRTL